MTIARMMQRQYLAEFAREYRSVIASAKESGADAVKHEIYEWDMVPDYEMYMSNVYDNNASIAENPNRPRRKRMRHDIALLCNGELTETFTVNCESNDAKIMLHGRHGIVSEFKGVVNGTMLTLDYFRWERCKLHIEGERYYVAGRIHYWFMSWYKIRTGPNPFFNVVHSCDGPYVSTLGDTFYMYVIDLGTAPCEAFVSLISILCNDGIREVVVRG